MGFYFDVDTFNASVARINGTAECSNGHSADMPSNVSPSRNNTCIIDIDAFNATLGVSPPKKVAEPIKEEHSGWTEEQKQKDMILSSKADEIADYLLSHPQEAIEFANTGKLRFDPFAMEKQQKTGLFREPTPDEVVFGKFEGASCFRNPSEDARNKERYEAEMKRQYYQNAVYNIPTNCRLPQNLQYVDPNNINMYKYASDMDKQYYYYNRQHNRMANQQQPQPVSPIAAAQQQTTQKDTDWNKEHTDICYSADLTGLIQQNMNEEEKPGNPGDWVSGHAQMIKDARNSVESRYARPIADIMAENAPRYAAEINDLATKTRKYSRFDPKLGKWVHTNLYTGWQKVTDSPDDDFDEELMRAGIIKDEYDTCPFVPDKAPDVSNMKEASSMSDEELEFLAQQATTNHDNDDELGTSFDDLIHSGAVTIDPKDPSHITFHLDPQEPQKVQLTPEEASFHKALCDDSTLDTGYTSERLKKEEEYNKQIGCEASSPATYNPVTGEMKPGYYQFKDNNGNSYRTPYTNPYAVPTTQNIGFYNPNSIYGYASNAYYGQNDYSAIDQLLAYEDSLNPRYVFDVNNAWRDKAIRAWSSAENEPIYTMQVPTGYYGTRTVYGTKSEIEAMKQNNETWRQRNIDIGCWLTKKACTYLGKEYDEQKVANRFDPYYSPYMPQNENPMVGKQAIDSDHYRSWMEEEKAAIDLMNFSRGIDTYNDYYFAVKQYACSKIQENFYRSLGLRPGDPCDLDYFLNHGWKYFADNRGYDVVNTAKKISADRASKSWEDELRTYIGVTKGADHLLDSPLARACGSRDPKTQLEFLKQINYDPDESKSFLLLPGEKGMETCLIPPGLFKEARELFKVQKMMEYMKKGNYGGMTELTGVDSTGKAVM